MHFVAAVALAAASATPAAPAPIPGTQLVRAAESAYTELRRIGELARPGDLDRIAVPVSTMAQEVERLRPALMGALEGDDEYVPREVGRRQAIVSGWEEQLSARVQLLAAAASSLRQLAETWRLTAASPDPDIPPALRARAVDVSDRAAGLDREVSDGLRSALELQDRVAAVKLALLSLLETANAVQATRRQELFEIESAPLWRTSAWTHSGWSPRLLPIPRTQLIAALEYAAAEPVRTFFHFAIAAALIAMAIALARAMRTVAAVPQRGPAVEALLHRPVDAAVLIALCLTPLLHPGRPPAIRLLVDLAAVVPVVRIVAALAPGWKRPAGCVAALFAVARVVVFAPHSGLPARVALIAVAVVASAGCAAGLRRDGWLRRRVAERWTAAATAGVALSGSLFAIAALANVVGNVSLSEFLLDAILSSLFGGLAVAAIAAVASGALRALLELPAVKQSSLVRGNQQMLVRRGGALLRAATAVACFAVALRSFHAVKPFRDAVKGVLQWSVKVGGLDLSLGDVVAFAVTLFVAVWLARAIKFLLDEAVLPALRVSRGSAAAISATAMYVAVAVGCGSAVLAGGVEMTRFTVLAGTLGVGIGFGLQNVVNNFVSGLILLYEQPVQVGDVIELGRLTGEVRRIGVRSSTVRTFQGADVIVPNSNFISAEVVNWTRSDRFRRVEIEVGVAYGTEPARVVELLLGTARSCDAVVTAPEPVALFTGFGESALRFELRVWTAVDDWVATASRLRATISEDLPRAGVVLAFPQLDLWVRSVPPGTSAAKVARGGIALAAPAPDETAETPWRR